VTFEQQRHREPVDLPHARPVVVALAPMRSVVNVAQIARTASACRVDHLLVCGDQRIDEKVARIGPDDLDIRRHRSLAPNVRKLRDAGYAVVAIEQTSGSTSIHEHRFDRRSVIVLGNERTGVPQDCLDLADHAVEIPMYGPPHSLNVAMAAAISLYEYCRQFPDG
jgi:tRNA G18 (ribose-2'-O)-methylase SpoU